MLALRDGERVVELCPLLRENLRALAHLVELAHSALAVMLHAAHAVLQLTEIALGALNRVARFSDQSPHLVLGILMPRQLGFGLRQLGLLTRTLRRGAFTLGGDLHARLLTGGRLGLGALPSSRRVA